MFVITGGGSGLGQALALALAERQQPVLIVGRRLEQLQETAAKSAHLSYFKADIASEEGRGSLMEFLAPHQHLKGLIHNAGIIEPIQSMMTITLDDWRTLMQTNLEAPLFLTQCLWPHLSQARILHMGSGAAYFPVHSWAAYCVSKAGLAMLTRCWQEEYPDLALTSVMPGIADTPMQALIRNSNSMSPDKHDFFCQLKSSQQLLLPEVVASFLVWLLLDISAQRFRSQEWDIYDTQHHAEWLQPPQLVPPIA